MKTVNCPLSKIKIISERLTTTLVELFKVPGALVKETLSLAGEYELIISMLVSVNERLQGKMEGMMVGKEFRMGATPSGVYPTNAPMVERVANPVQLTGKEVATKVMKEVGPHLNVRVHEIKALKGVGAIITTPSVAERENVANNAKFKETGLVVQEKTG